MAAGRPPSPRIPPPAADDPEDVRVALETATTMLAIDNRGEALRWLRQAAGIAMQADDPRRGVELAKIAAEMAPALDNPALAAPTADAGSVLAAGRAAATPGATATRSTTEEDSPLMVDWSEGDSEQPTAVRSAEALGKIVLDVLHRSAPAPQSTDDYPDLSEEQTPMFPNRAPRPAADPAETTLVDHESYDRQDAPGPAADDPDEVTLMPAGMAAGPEDDVTLQQESPRQDAHDPAVPATAAPSLQLRVALFAVPDDPVVRVILLPHGAVPPPQAAVASVTAASERDAKIIAELLHRGASLR